MTDMMTLSAKFVADTTQFVNGVHKAQDTMAQGETAAKKLDATLGKLKTAFAAVVSIAGITKIATSLKGLADSAAAAGDRIDKNSQALGLSRKAYQEWDYILGQSGASIDSLGVSMKTINSAIMGGDKGTVKALGSLGLSLKTLQGQSQEDQFESLVRAFQKLPAGANKSALALQLFGRNGQSLMPLLNSAPDAIDSMRQDMERMGFVMSDSMVDSSVKYGDTLDNLKRTFGGLKNTLGYALQEPLTKIFQAITDFFSDEDVQTEVKRFAVDLNNLGNLVFDGVQGFFDFLKEHKDEIGEALDNISTFLGDIFTTVTGAAVELFTELKDALADFLANASPEQVAAVAGLATALGLIFNPALTLTVALIALAANWKEVKKWAGEASTKLQDWTDEKLSQVKQGLQNLADKIAPLEDAFFKWKEQMAAFIRENVIENVRKAIEKLRDTFVRIKNAVHNAKERFKEWLRALDNPISNALLNALEKIENAFNAVRDAIAGVIAKLKEWQELQGKSNQEKVDALDAGGLTSGDTDRAVKAWQGYEDLWNNQASGISYVPRNGYHANLHEGEAVLTKRQAGAWRSGSSSVSPQAIAQAVSSALEGMNVVMDGQQVGRLTAQTVSREIARSARTGRLAYI